MLDQRGEALDPVAVVGVEDAVDLAQLGMVDVPADDAVHTALARLARQRLFEVADIADRPLYLVLQEARQRGFLLYAYEIAESILSNQGNATQKKERSALAARLLLTRLNPL